jgi:glycosyltransferase involved in cell wall biosynthesis
VAEREPPLELFAARRAQPQLLVVGQNYRDFDQLEHILASRAERRVTTHLVGADAAVRERFAARSDVIWHARLSREAYERLLRESFALLLPLTFATANNALLEAYAGCLPVFATRIAGITDYVVDGDRSLFGSPEEFWRKYDALAQLEPLDLRQQGLRLRCDSAARFAWPSVRAQLATLY